MISKVETYLLVEIRRLCKNERFWGVTRVQVEFKLRANMKKKIKIKLIVCFLEITNVPPAIVWGLFGVHSVNIAEF